MILAGVKFKVREAKDLRVGDWILCRGVMRQVRSISIETDDRYTVHLWGVRDPLSLVEDEYVWRAEEEKANG